MTKDCWRIIQAMGTSTPCIEQERRCHKTSWAETDQTPHHQKGSDDLVGSHKKPWTKFSGLIRKQIKLYRCDEKTKWWVWRMDEERTCFKRRVCSFCIDCIRAQSAQKMNFHSQKHWIISMLCYSWAQVTVWIQSVCTACYMRELTVPFNNLQ